MDRFNGRYQSMDLSVVDLLRGGVASCPPPSPSVARPRSDGSRAPGAATEPERRGGGRRV